MQTVFDFALINKILVLQSLQINMTHVKAVAKAKKRNTKQERKVFSFLYKEPFPILRS